MTLLAIPNVSEGRDRGSIKNYIDAMTGSGASVLDIHSDAAHNRSVFTVTGDEDSLVEAMADLAVASLAIDLRRHRGLHPRTGTLDVCPFVPHEEPLTGAVATAHSGGRAIAARAGVPVYFYADAAPDRRDLPSIRKGGLDALIRRSERDFPPDLGPRRIDPKHGVVCVGARSTLIAFNVWLACDEATVKKIAARTRTSGGGPPSVRALGFALDDDRAQVSMNLVDPDTTGIEAAFDVVAAAAGELHATIVATEIVGLVPGRYLPAPQTKAARLLTQPGRSLESALADV